jgi:hypothetical protein
VYFEVPGSGNIQNLAFGDFHDANTSEVAGGEAFTGGGVEPYCPVLGQTNTGHWNYDGEPASLSTFASNMNLYKNGSWYLWTTSVAPTNTYVNAPYQLVQVSNFGAGNYYEWKSGGPQ